MNKVRPIRRLSRPGQGTGGSPQGQVPQTIGTWPCKDGYVVWRLMAGLQSRRQNGPMIQWMDEEGMADDFIKNFDWDNFDLRQTTQETVERLYEPIRRFFMVHTKAELLEGAVKRRVLLYPVSTTADILESVQLAARNFWVKLEHPELNATITYPGAFSNASEAPPQVSRRAPLIGEHNEEIYEGEIGLTKEELVRLKQAKVI